MYLGLYLLTNFVDILILFYRIGILTFWFVYKVGTFCDCIGLKYLLYIFSLISITY